jgi:tetratricopeptide (TPR) repeat protein
LIEGQDYHSSLETLSEVLEIDSTSVSAYVLQAKAYRELGEFGKEQASLETLTKHDADSVEPLKRLLELTTNNRQWEKAKTYARRLTALNPLIRYLSIAAEKTGDDIATIESLSVLTRLNPLDRADIHFRLASALFRENNLPLAKRHVLMALEQAPRYRDAHQLLLSILAAGEVSNEPASDSSTDVPATEETVEAKDAK